MLMVPLSTVVLSAIFVASWISQDVNSIVDWSTNPPLNDHIRHTGYIVTASASIAFAFALYRSTIDRQFMFYILLLLVSATLLFWTGGRASAISFFGTSILLIGYLIYANKLKFNHLVVTCLILALAVYLSELLSVFDWNGITTAISRSKETSDMQTLTTGRTTIWLSVLSSLESHWLFGLKPQGYIFMPNHIYGVHPHNIFLQFIVEWGLLGAGVFLFLLIRVGIRIIQSIKNRKKIASVSFLSGVAVTSSLTIHSLVDGTYYHGQPSYYIALALAVCLAAISINEKKLPKVE